MRRARGHFDKAHVIRYYSITFWPLHLKRDPLKITKRDIAISHYLAFFFRRKALQHALIDKYSDGKYDKIIMV